MNWGKVCAIAVAIGLWAAIFWAIGIGRLL